MAAFAISRRTFTLRYLIGPVNQAKSSDLSGRELCLLSPLRDSPSAEPFARHWQPLEPVARRVVSFHFRGSYQGVLMKRGARNETRKPLLARHLEPAPCLKRNAADLQACRKRTAGRNEMSFQHTNPALVTRLVGSPQVVG
jgi:hypothetical protein